MVSMSLLLLAVVFVLLSLSCEVRAKLKEGDCEGMTVLANKLLDIDTNYSYYYYTVCVQLLGKFARHLKENDVGSNVDKIEMELMKFCTSATGKDERFVRTRKIPCV